MKKTTVVLGVAALAAATAMTAYSQGAEAGPRGRALGIGVGVGVGLGLALGSAAANEREAQRRAQRQREYSEPRREKNTRTTKARSEPTKEALYADANGREFDPGSKVWFDGKGACWTGSQKWTVKNGLWHYGSNRWFEANGAWQVAKASAGPKPVDCATTPIFAARLVRPEPAAATATGQTATNTGQSSTTQGQVSEAAEAPTRPTAGESTASDTGLARDCSKDAPIGGQSTAAAPCT